MPGSRMPARPIPAPTNNASGVAVLIELAANFTAGTPPSGISICRFSAEEAGLLARATTRSIRSPLRGRHRRRHQSRQRGTAGRQPLIGTGHRHRDGVAVRASARHAVTASPGEASREPRRQPASFIERGVPGVQSSPAPISTITAPPTRRQGQPPRHGQVATFVKEATGYRFSVRSLGAGGQHSGRGFRGFLRIPDDRPANTEGQRRVSFGTCRICPQFSGGAGGTVVPGSPAELAGIQAGDVLVA